MTTTTSPCRLVANPHASEWAPRPNRQKAMSTKPPASSSSPPSALAPAPSAAAAPAPAPGPAPALAFILGADSVCSACTAERSCSTLLETSWVDGLWRGSVRTHGGLLTTNRQGHRPPNHYACAWHSQECCNTISANSRGRFRDGDDELDTRGKQPAGTTISHKHCSSTRSSHVPHLTNCTTMCVVASTWPATRTTGCACRVEAR